MININLRFRSFVYLLSALILASSACGSEVAEVSELIFDGTSVMHEGNLLIQVDTDLQDGTLLVYEVREGELGLGEGYAEGTMTVSDGIGFARINVSNWQENKIRVFAAFQLWTEGQPQSVIDRFGNTGQNLTGTNVFVAGDIKSIEFLNVVSK